MRARDHLHDGFDRDDDLLLRFHALARERERLLGERGDPLGAIGLDLRTVDHQRHDRDQREGEQARAHADRGLRPCAFGKQVGEK